MCIRDRAGGRREGRKGKAEHPVFTSIDQLIGLTLQRCPVLYTVLQLRGGWTESWTQCCSTDLSQFDDLLLWYCRIHGVVVWKYSDTGRRTVEWSLQYVWRHHITSRRLQGALLYLRGTYIVTCRVTFRYCELLTTIGPYNLSFLSVSTKCAKYGLCCYRWRQLEMRTSLWVDCRNLTMDATLLRSAVWHVLTNEVLQEAP